MKSYAILIVLAIGNFISLSLCNNPQVKISDGELKGIFLKSREDKTYSAFRGIPYAKPPTRFQVAEIPEPWQKPRDASKFGNICLQKPIFADEFKMSIVGDEDCLFLNVYAPGKLEKKNLPVMVFIHGGAFVGGSGNQYGANYFMDHDIVLVTLNYRLGALGFLSTNDGVIEGNLGLKDQNLALKWVQKNIKAFGGDPKKVTIFGESAGAASVHYHVLSPLNVGLFHQAIIQSGSAINPWAFTDNPSEPAFDVGNALGCKTDCSKKLLKCLQGKDVLNITNVDLREWYLDPIVPFSPVKDSPDSKLVFIPDAPTKLLESGTFNKVPLIVTACKDEGLLLHSAAISRTATLRTEMNEDWLRILPITLIYRHLGLEKSEQNWISSQVKKFYFGTKDVGQETLTNLTNMYTDRYFTHGLEKVVNFHAKHSTVYNGVFSYKGEKSLLSLFGITENLGFAHGDDLLYLFNDDYYPKISPIDENFSKLIVSVWTKFATSGKPEAKDMKWIPFSTRGEPTWLNINFPPGVLENPFKERIQFWDRMWGKSSKDEL